MDLLDHVSISDLDEVQRTLALIIGLDNYKKLVREYGGMSIYIPKAEGFELNYRNEKIRSEFNGYNYRELAQQYRLSEVRVRAIVNDITKYVRNKPMDGQEKLF